MTWIFGFGGVILGLLIAAIVVLVLETKRTARITRLQKGAKYKKSHTIPKEGTFSGEEINEWAKRTAP